MARHTFTYLDTTEGKGALAFVLLAAGGAILFFYGVGKDVGANACATYTEAAKVRIEDVTKNAIQATSALNTAALKFVGLVEETRGYQDVVKENKELTTKAAQLTSKLAEAEKQRDDLKDKYDKLTGPTPISISANQADVIAGKVHVGVVGNPFSGLAKLLIENKPYDVTAGTLITTIVQGETCSIHIDVVDVTRVVLDGTCASEGQK